MLRKAMHTFAAVLVGGLTTLIVIRAGGYIPLGAEAWWLLPSGALAVVVKALAYVAEQEEHETALAAIVIRANGC